jgi:putative PIN family toxin of toxin-antitoxin system
MRVVLDTNVLARATKSASGPARELLTILTQPAHRLITSAVLLAELMRVLEYPRVQALHGLTRDGIEEFVLHVFHVAEVVSLEATEITTVVAADPDDDSVIQTAVRGKAEVICTLDRHLHRDQVRHYCQARGIRVLDDVTLLRSLRQA